MPTEIMPERAENAAQTLHRLIRRGPAEAAGDLEAFAVLAVALAGLIESAWDVFLNRLHRGMETEEVKTRGDAISRAADTWSEMAQSLRQTGEEAGRLAGAPVAGLAEVLTVVTRIDQIRASARAAVDAVNAALDEPLDPDMLRRAADDVAARRVQKGTDLAARLRSPRSAPPARRLTGP
jgi:hypothetical protein